MSGMVGAPPGMGQPGAPPGGPPGASGMGGPGMGGNVVPMPMQPRMVPNPEFAQWQKHALERASIIARNTAKQHQFDEAIELIRKDGVAGFRLDIESDSTIALDQAQERTDRTEFISALLPLLQQIVPIAQGNPQAAEFGKELVQFGVRSFPVARGMEESIDRMFDALAGMPAPQPKGAAGKAPPDPALEKAKIEADVSNVKTQASTDATIAAAKEQTARLAIAQKQQQAQGQERIAQSKIESETQRSYVDLAIQASESQHQQEMAGHKAAADAAKGME